MKGSNIGIKITDNLVLYDDRVLQVATSSLKIKYRHRRLKFKNEKVPTSKGGTYGNS